jgi:hypothetical protein
MDKDAAIELIRASPLRSRLDDIEPHLAPCLRIRATREPTAGKALVSRFAGNGVLPRGAAWPVWDHSAMCSRWIRWCEERISQHGATSVLVDEIERHRAQLRDNPKPIDFLALIRLADIAPHADLLGLPDRGALLFFYDVQRTPASFWPEARGGWQIVYVESDDGLTVVDEPPISQPDFHPSTLKFELEYVLPQDIRDDDDDDDLCCHINEDYTRIYALLRGDADVITHQLGGPPEEIQHGLFSTCHFAANGVDTEPSEEDLARQSERYWALRPGVKDWRLVLQIDTDEEGPGWMWGDCGRLYYCLHRDDVAARRFDRSWCVDQCH